MSTGLVFCLIFATDDDETLIGGSSFPGRASAFPERKVGV